jgi:hypothetical protein
VTPLFETGAAQILYEKENPAGSNLINGVGLKTVNFPHTHQRGVGDGHRMRRVRLGSQPVQPLGRLIWYQPLLSPRTETRIPSWTVTTAMLSPPGALQ